MDDLLAGPRGRRLCWAHARYCAHDAGRGRFLDLAAAAAWPWDQAQLVSTHTAPGPVPPTAEVATALDDVPATVPDDEALLDLLDTAVLTARYWQPPDGDDVVAAEPALRPGLARFAAAVAAAPGTAWWSTGLDTDRQRVVRWHDETGPPPARGSVDPPGALAAQRVATVDDEARSARELPDDPAAPYSGPWWSCPAYELVASTRDLGARGPVGLWFVEDGHGWTRAGVSPVTVSPGARVTEIDGPDDWADLCRRHPLEVTAARRHDWYRTTGRAGRWVLPDWTRVAEGTDAVHLTVRGWLTTAGRAVEVADGVASVLAGWDPDQAYWLTATAWPDGPETPWRRDGTDGWMPDRRS
ncbi:hypothetical protein GCM10025792_12550 [Pseudonocardia tropica]